MSAAEYTADLRNMRSGFGLEGKYELKFLQTHLLNLILEFDEICRKHNIEYYLDGGSVIGAIRHRGFVPWDDDIDILIKSEEFDKLLKIIDTELELRQGRVFSYMGRTMQHHRPFARYVHIDIPHIVRTSTVEATYIPGVFLDIFILDGVSSKRLQSYKKTLEKSEDWYHRFLRGVVGQLSLYEYKVLFFLEKLFGNNRIERFLVSRIRGHSGGNIDFYIPRNGFNYGIYEKEIFQEPKYLPFEGHLLPVPSKPESYLREHYGTQWFLMPPKDQQDFTHYTLTSTTLTTRELMEPYNWLHNSHQVREHQSKEYSLRISRKRILNKQNALKQRMQAQILTGEISEAIQNSNIFELLKDHQYKQASSLLGSLITRLIPVINSNIQMNFKTEVASAIALILSVEKDYDLALKMIRLQKFHDKSMVTFIESMVNLEVYIQDGKYSEAKKISDSLKASNYQILETYVADIKIGGSKFNHYEISNIIKFFESRVTKLDEIYILYAEALTIAGLNDDAKQICKELVNDSVNGRVVLRARELLKKIITETQNGLS